MQKNGCGPVSTKFACGRDQKFWYLQIGLCPTPLGYSYTHIIDACICFILNIIRRGQFFPTIERILDLRLLLCFAAQLTWNI